MTLSQLDGPSVERDAIPLAWQLDAPTASDWEMSRYLQVLADFEQSNDCVEDSPQNAKADLMLLWLARSLNTPMPSSTAAVIGLEFVIWRAVQAFPVAQNGILAFCLSEQFPLLLQFPAQIVTCTPMKNGFEIKAAWSLMSHCVQESFEKTIFRYHRRHIQQLRERKV